MDQKDKKMTIAGGINVCIALATGAVGITAVKINSFECLIVSLTDGT